MPRKPTQEECIKQRLIEELDFTSCKAFFAGIDDPRIERTKDHLLSDILLLSLCAILSGAQAWTEIERYGKDKKDMLRKFLDLPNGIPSHDTIGRVFGAIDPAQFEACFLAWTKSQVPRIQGLVAIDGKTIRASGDATRSPVHLVSAWSDANSLVLAQVRTAEKSNEITAIPVLLNALNLQEGTVVSFDAMGCQRDIARQITSKNVDYLMALKDNQENLHKCVQRAFNQEGVKIATEEVTVVNKGHGRLETRRCVIATDVEWIKQDHKWPELRTIIMLERTREIKGKVQMERAFYLSSLLADPGRFNELVRRHWGIENKLHWVLDVAFNEDRSTARVAAAGENFATLRKIAINLIRSAKTQKSIRGNMLSSGWNEQHFLSLISRLGSAAP